MLPPARRNPHLSVDDYLRFEAEGGGVRHEYVGGDIFAMSGGSAAHNRIAGNVFAAFSNHLRGGPCEAYISDFKVRLQANRYEIFYYPDVMVACGREGTEKFYLTNPKLIVEVLSPSTESIDRREKALNYRQIDSLEEYVLIAQETHEITIHRRDAAWEAIVITSPEADIEFRSLALSLPMNEIYRGVEVQREPHR